MFCSTTVKSVLNGHSKIDKPKILMTNGSLMQVNGIAECSPWSILQYFDLHYGIIGLESQFSVFLHRFYCILILKNYNKSK